MTYRANPIPVRDRTLLGKNGYMSTSDLREEFRRERSQPILLGDEPFRKLVRVGIDRDVFVYGKGDVVFALGTPPLTIDVREDALLTPSETPTRKVSGRSASRARATARLRHNLGTAA